MNEFDYSGAGLALTRSFEGLRLSAYQDSAGVWTIGYGHTGPEVHAGQRITEPEAETLLRTDLATAIECVRRAVRVELTQGQFDALVDFCFNAGRGNFLGSSLLRLANAAEMASAAQQFGLWVHAGGRVVPGLVRRRAAEAQLFAGSGLILQKKWRSQPSGIHTVPQMCQSPYPVRHWHCPGMDDSLKKLRWLSASFDN